jgi:hypothetical protein
MKKFLHFYDTYALKIGISLLIIIISLYPKLPSVHIIRTWVYIRVEDFFILAVTLIWFIQALRKKVKIPFVIGLPIIIFWLVGLASLIYSLIFIAPGLTNFFPHIAILNYLRRIEYMILFFVAASSVKSVKDVRDYLIVFCLTSLGVVLYGFGQRYYLDLWVKFPAFFEKYSFCFPSFQTGNEEFAKGIPLCLPGGSRLTSTFGGHYDLAAYLVLMIPVLVAVSLSVKKLWLRIFSFVLSFFNLILLIFTASRVSFIAYLIATIFALSFYKKKLIIIPVVLISIILLFVFSASTFKRFLATARVSSVVTNMQGQLIGETTSGLTDELKKKISQNETGVQKPPPIERLPEGSGFIGLPQNTGPVTTNVAVVKKTLSPEEIRRLKITSGSLEISSVTGSFLIRKVLVYDISFTTRFQGEWPNAWKAFLRNPLLGSGYSTITLATDNDYFRALGETGILGLVSFLFIFLILGITVKEIIPSVNQPLVRGLVFGLAGGVIGLMINAMLIDVFEASKLAENLWILLGIGIGGLLLFKKKQVPYLLDLKKIFTSNIFISIYIFLLTFIFFSGSINHFFTAVDFTLLHSAATSSTGDIIKYFTNFQNTPYEPLSRTIIFLLYTVFSLQPQGYHVILLLLHSLASLLVYFIAHRILKKKMPAFIAALFFLLNPLLAENIFWLSTFSVTLSSIFIMFALFCFLKPWKNKSVIKYLIPLIFIIFSFLTHEPSLAVIFYLLYAGLSILVVFIISKKTSTLPLLIFTAIILAIFLNELKQEEIEWRYAGNFTRNMLSTLRLEYESLQKTSNVYFISVPVKYGNAWIFPTGLTDSLWFIYQQNNPHIYQVKSVNEAKNLILKNKTKNNYIFEFDKDGIVKSIQ